MPTWCRQEVGIKFMYANLSVGSEEILKKRNAKSGIANYGNLECVYV